MYTVPLFLLSVFKSLYKSIKSRFCKVQLFHGLNGFNLSVFPTRIYAFPSIGNFHCRPAKLHPLGFCHCYPLLLPFMDIRTFLFCCIA